MSLAERMKANQEAQQAIDKRDAERKLTISVEKEKQFRTKLADFLDTAGEQWRADAANGKTKFTEFRVPDGRFETESPFYTSSWHNGQIEMGQPRRGSFSDPSSPYFNHWKIFTNWLDWEGLEAVLRYDWSSGGEESWYTLIVAPAKNPKTVTEEPVQARRINVPLVSMVPVSKVLKGSTVCAVIAEILATSASQDILEAHGLKDNLSVGDFL